MHSPVAELGQADLLLAAAVVGGFVSMRAIAGDDLAERIFLWGVALLLLANIVVIGQQIQDPSYSPIFRTRRVTYGSGYFATYNEAANYLIACSLIVGGAAWFGRHGTFTRVMWFVIAALGLASVWFTRSRGGIFGAAVGSGVFAVVALVMSKRRGSRWFAPAVIAIPVIGLALGSYFIIGWQEAQEIRTAGSGIDGLLDNSCRLYYLGIALSCIGLHPLAGGGSRSFSWECYRFWESAVQGAGGARPDMVHNEVVQALTDYGLVGGGLLVGLLGALALAAVLRVLFDDVAKIPGSADVWRLGALAGLAGMLVQSSFSFVFHQIPGALLLGICLAPLSRTIDRAPGKNTLGTRVLLTLAAISSVLLLLPAGWAGTQVTRILWPVYFGKQPLLSAESRIDALSEAISLWPQTEFYQERAALFQSFMGSAEDGGLREPAERAINDYQAAARLNPYDPGLAVNAANLLSVLRRDAEAEVEYARAIVLQGGMESGFRGHYSFAAHSMRKGLRQFHRNQSAALESLEHAAIAIEEAVKQTPGYVMGNDGRSMRISIHENLGRAREAAGNTAGALLAYDMASSIPTGARVHYEAGVLIGRMAVESWSQRQAPVALKQFLDARKRIAQAGNELPAGVTSKQRAEFIVYLDRMIAFLKGAKVVPSE
ncbi:MAG: hypothetical protein RLZZ282_1548 [Verrucomicrobiota bacterium]